MPQGCNEPKPPSAPAAGCRVMSARWGDLSAPKSPLGDSAYLIIWRLIDKREKRNEKRKVLNTNQSGDATLYDNDKSTAQ
mmetsp:Transcript_70385/g.132405  ORF Transcript_70385/g.132405 Transcript_70385/m.132405 type:complete len:80 (+) Transcript_70385:873-1112(+)